MLSSRRLHEHIRDRIKSALYGRPVKWLAKEAGVPQSTLARQMARPKFSLDVLLRVARTLEKDFAFFLSWETPNSVPAAGWMLADLEEVGEKWRRRLDLDKATGTRNREAGQREPDLE